MPKVLRPRSSSRYSLVRTLSTSSSKKWSDAPKFLRVKSSSRHSIVHILSTSSSKNGLMSPIFNDLYLKSSSRYSLCTCCRSLSPIEAETVFQRGPGTATLPEKTEGFASENVFKREFTRSRSLTLPNYLMMIWLT